ncbi:hypothetical protein CAOG_008114 [Capsaspora owczarzaki ATCC 30864]|uniref:NOD3 protein n=2 Tax=Capsaspora owczarzaki (strain ATCC 30864) TaxID=595528 RepID=A0A0D2WYM8_CAPO3|nr:hypothetical protein CAOG_008114 [Capsaspora owczarzaki ATCC 30864]
MDDAAAQVVAEALKSNTTLTQLNLGRNQIGDTGAQAIAEALKVNKAVTVLGLNENRVGDAGAQAVAEALKVNSTATQLILHDNQIGDDGALAIAEALKVNSRLIWLDLERNQIGDAGAQAIAEALKVNKTIAEVELRYNCIGNAGANALDEACTIYDTCEVDFSNQVSPLAFSLFPRSATAEELQTVFHLLISGLEQQHQSSSLSALPVLPALPEELAERIMDEAFYWQGVQHIKRLQFASSHPADTLKVTVPRSIDGTSIRVKAIQVLRDRKELSDVTNNSVFDLIVRDGQGAVQYECAAKPTLVDSTLQSVTIWPADHPIIRQIREGWEVQVRPSKFARDVRFESLYVGYV